MKKKLLSVLVMMVLFLPVWAEGVAAPQVEQVRRLSGIDYAVVAAFFVVMIGVGLWFGRRSKNTDQFFGGDHCVPWWLSGVSFYMCSFSALAFVMYSAMAYKYGWVPVTVSWLSVPAVLLGVKFLAVRWRRAAKRSPVEFVATRYTARTCKSLVWLGLPMQVLDNAFKLLAIGTVLGTMAKSLFPEGYPLSTVLGWAIAVSGVVIVFYTFLGGLKATLVCDFIQFFVILAVVLTLPFLCLGRLSALDGGAGLAHGLNVFLQRAPEGFFRLTNGQYDWCYMVVFFFLVGSNLSTTWSLVQRYSSTKSEKDARRMGYLVSALLFLGPPIFFFPAMAARVFIPDLNMDSSDAMNGVYATICLQVLPSGLIGLVVAAMFSATMSTLAGGYNAISSVLTNEIYGRVNPTASTKDRMRAARLFTILVGIAVVGLTFLMRAAQGKSDLFDVTNKMFAVFLPPIALTMLAGVLIRSLSKRAGVCGLAGGIGVGLVVFIAGAWYPPLRQMAPMTAITCLTTFAGLFAGTKCLPDTPSEREQVEAFHRSLEG